MEEQTAHPSPDTLARPGHQLTKAPGALWINYFRAILVSAGSALHRNGNRAQVPEKQNKKTGTPAFAEVLFLSLYRDISLSIILFRPVVTAFDRL